MLLKLAKNKKLSIKNIRFNNNTVIIIIKLRKKLVERWRGWIKRLKLQNLETNQINKINWNKNNKKN